MSLRTKYVLFYLTSVIAPALIFIIGTALIYSMQAADNALSVTSLYLICIFLFLAGGFTANFWYGKKLGIEMIWRVLAAVFSTIGFVYLLGQEKNLISAVQIARTSFDLFIAHWKILLKYALLYLVPTIILGLIGGATFVLSYYLHTPMAVNGLIILLVVTVTMVATLWLSIALAQVIKNLLQRQPLMTIKQTLKSNNHLLWPVIYTSLLSALIIIGGSLLFLVPGVVFSIWYAFVFYSVIFENKKGIEALRDSKTLVIGRWFAILWRISVPAVIFGVVAFAITSIIQLPFMLFPENNITDFANAALGNIVSVALMPLTATASVVLFLEAKKSKPASTSAKEPVIM